MKGRAREVDGFGIQLHRRGVVVARAGLAGGGLECGQFFWY